MTKDTTATPAGRERADSGPEWPRLVIAEDYANNPTLWLERHGGDSQPRPIIGEHEARDAWPLLVAAIEGAEVKRLTAERDEARAALAALRGDVEALIVVEYDTESDEAHGTNPRRPFINPADLAAVLANHPTTKEADRG